MKVKCNYCDQMIDEGNVSCPFCGAAMPTANRVAGGQPKTIEELKQWYQDHKLPPEEITRFFIGKDVREPKAFGIYQDERGDFVVYKNKSNGERAIRYQGVDEGYAVNELYQRLRSEIADQKANGSAGNQGGQKGRSDNGGNAKKKKTQGIFARILDTLLTLIILPFVNPVFATIYIVMALVLFCIFDHSPSKGYYNYNGNDYYYQGSSWYSYDPYYDTWSYATNGDELNQIINDETALDYRTDNHVGMRFEDSNWYDSGSSNDDHDWDSDSSWGNSTWDSGSSWDFGGTDWDSDW